MRPFGFGRDDNASLATNFVGNKFPLMTNFAGDKGLP
jgi:hypothetical protein